MSLRWGGNISGICFESLLFCSGDRHYDFNESRGLVQESQLLSLWLEGTYIIIKIQNIHRPLFQQSHAHT